MAREISRALAGGGHAPLCFDRAAEGDAWRFPWVIGVGSPTLRKVIARRCPFDGEKPIDLLIDDMGRARLMLEYDFARRGCIRQAGARGTCDITLGVHTLVNLNVTIGHDVKLGDYSVINPGANISGHVTIGECVLVGAGACIREGVTIGDGATVGMGSVVLKDVPAGEVWVGNPARRLR